MNNYLKEKQLSIGFNPKLGQTFFDLLNNPKHRKYIHSYFFSLNTQFPGDGSGKNLYTAPSEISELIKNLNTYDIPANLLLNDKYAENNRLKFLNMVKDIINLDAVTVLSLNAAKEIKKIYPNVKVHLSVRYFDWAIEDFVISGKELSINEARKIIWEKTNEIIDSNKEFKYIDVINVSGAYSFNDFDLFSKIKNAGIQTKIIVNESCLANRYLMFKHFENTKSCYDGNCGECYALEKYHQWVNLTRNDIYKESIKYYHDIDIFKLSLRGANLEETERVISYYTSDEKTSFIRFNTSRTKIYLMDKCYKIFLEYIDQISKCSRNCFYCKKCKDYYEKLMKENFLL